MKKDKIKEKYKIVYYIIVFFLLLNILSMWIQYYFELEYIWSAYIFIANIIFLILIFVVMHNWNRKNNMFVFTLIILFFLVNSITLLGEVIKEGVGTREKKVYFSPNLTNTIVVEEKKMLASHTFNVYKGKWFIYREIDYYMDYEYVLDIRWINNNSAYVIQRGDKYIVKFK